MKPLIHRGVCRWIQRKTNHSFNALYYCYFTKCPHAYSICQKREVSLPLMQLGLQTDIYLAGDRGAGREVRERAGQLCPPGEFGMCPPRASRRPRVKVNKGAMWTASSSLQQPLTNPFFHPSSHSPVTGIRLFIHWPRPPLAIHTSSATCRLFYILQFHVQTWGQGPFSTVCNSLTVKRSRVAAVDGLRQGCKQRFSICRRYSPTKTHCSIKPAHTCKTCLSTYPVSGATSANTSIYTVDYLKCQAECSIFSTHEGIWENICKRWCIQTVTKAGEVWKPILSWGDGEQKVPIPQ